jgi:hypothetical protein
MAVHTSNCLHHYPNILALTFLCSLHASLAASSKECLARLHNHKAGYCREPTCGKLQQDIQPERFLDRLGPSCTRSMMRYTPEIPEKGLSQNAVRSTQWMTMHGLTEASTLLLTNDRDDDFVKCSDSFSSRLPTNPVVVQRSDSSSFVMCTVPKAGCSFLRSLLFMLTRADQQPLDFHINAVHDAVYPTIWHYSHETDVSDRWPSVRSSNG